MGKRAWLTALLACALGACSAENAADVDQSNGAVTSIKNTYVKQQTIGNCWLYAITGWAEALHKNATGLTTQLSVSYLQYWDFFDQVASAGKCGAAVRDGGTWERATELLRRYGLMRAVDFIPEEVGKPEAPRQKEAMEALQAALKDPNSALSKAASAKDRVGIRKAFDAAWKLSPETIARLDAAFGPDASRTLEKRTPAYDVARVIPPREFQIVPGERGASGLSLDAAIKAQGGWTEALPPWMDGTNDVAAQRNFQKRIQRALNDNLPVLVSWWVDLNALDEQGAFKVEQRGKKGAGEGGPHMSLVTDYEVTNVPGFGTLAAGRAETRPEALTAALDDRAKVKFFRIKNSWGSLAPKIQAPVAGYNDLYAGFLDSTVTVKLPASMLAESTGGDPCGGAGDSSAMFDQELEPLLGVVLPPGY